MSKPTGIKIWDVGRLPFIYKSLSKPTNGHNIPNFLPYKLFIDPTTQTLTQYPHPKLSYYLNKAYSKGSVITGAMASQGIGKEYTDDFINFITKSLKRNKLTGLKVLEIGCGSGYLLSRLKLLGAQVFGVEPGPQGRKGADEYQIPLIQDFFPSKKITDKFDLIIIYCVLEHIAVPMEILKNIRATLTETGIMVLTVEDEEPYIKAGDVSFFFHEHYSYFTKSTLKTLLRLSGFRTSNIHKASFSKLLYASAGKSNRPLGQSFKPKSSPQQSLSQFRKKSWMSLNTLSLTIKKFVQKGQTVGIYVPGRIVNALVISKIPLNGIRFFDDNPMLHNTFFPGINIKIESRAELLKNPPHAVLIMSNSFGKKIRQSLAPLLKEKTEILTWTDIFK